MLLVRVEVTHEVLVEGLAPGGSLKWEHRYFWGVLRERYCGHLSNILFVDESCKFRRCCVGCFSGTGKRNGKKMSVLEDHVCFYG